MSEQRSGGIHLSRDAHARLEQELHELTTEGRVRIARAIEQARELGDLSENADYHAAKDDQARMESRIRQVAKMLENAVIVEDAGPEGVVRPGRVVSIRYEGDDESERYLIGSIEEKREDVDVISLDSPLGQAILDHRIGEKVVFEAPNGAKLQVEITGIE